MNAPGRKDPRNEREFAATMVVGPYRFHKLRQERQSRNPWPRVALALLLLVGVMAGVRK